MFPDFREERPSVEPFYASQLVHPSHHPSYVPKGFPYVAAWVPLVEGYLGDTIALLAPGPVMISNLPCAGFWHCRWWAGEPQPLDSCWFTGKKSPVHWTLRLLLVKPGPGVSAELLTGRSGSWSLVSRPSNLQSWCQITGRGGDSCICSGYPKACICFLVWAGPGSTWS